MIPVVAMTGLSYVALYEWHESIAQRRSRRSHVSFVVRWLMVHHHASMPPAPQSIKELRAAMGLGAFQLGEVIVYVC